MPSCTQLGHDFLTLLLVVDFEGNNHLRSLGLVVILTFLAQWQESLLVKNGLVIRQLATPVVLITVLLLLLLARWHASTSLKVIHLLLILIQERSHDPHGCLFRVQVLRRRFQAIEDGNANGVIAVVNRTKDTQRHPVKNKLTLLVANQRKRGYTAAPVRLREDGVQERIRKRVATRWDLSNITRLLKGAYRACIKQKKNTHTHTADVSTKTERMKSTRKYFLM